MLDIYYYKMKWFIILYIKIKFIEALHLHKINSNKNKLIHKKTILYIQV